MVEIVRRGERQRRSLDELQTGRFEGQRDAEWGPHVDGVRTAEAVTNVRRVRRVTGAGLSDPGRHAGLQRRRAAVTEAVVDEVDSCPDKEQTREDAADAPNAGEHHGMKTLYPMVAV